jgi:hypothetical protein
MNLESGAVIIEGITALRVTTEKLRAQLDDVRNERDYWRDQAQAIARQLAAIADRLK